MTSPTERGLFERIAGMSRFHAAKIGQPDEYRVSRDRLQHICSEYEQQLAAAREEMEKLNNQLLVVKPAIQFLEGLSHQKPEKPDYWSSCSQCERNTNDADDLLDKLAAPLPEKNG